MAAQEVAPVAAPPPAPAGVHIIVLVDTTGSMGSYCSSVGSTLNQLFAVLDVLFEGTANVRIVAYEDYCDGPRLLRTPGHDRLELARFAAGLKAGGGGDSPEAVKTALNRVVEDLRALNAAEPGASTRTVVIHYTDAPPHAKERVGSSADHLKKETAALKGKSPGFDWVRIVQAFRDLGTPVVTFLPSNYVGSIQAHFMAMLGDTILLPNTDSKTITEYTMGTMLQLMAQPFKEITCNRFADQWDLTTFENEDSKAFSSLLQATMVSVQHSFAAHPAFARDLRRLVDSFQASTAFQDMVFRSLQELLVGESALALTYNVVLGTLWRLVCKRREDPRVAPLCDALSKCCQTLAGPSQAQLRAWVDESYNQLDEIRELVRAVPDPLVQGVLVLDVKGDEMPTKEEMRSIMHAPLPGVLKKVQGLLSRLMVVTSGALPVEEVDDAPMYLPLALSDKDLFSNISHLLLPGLQLSMRPAAMIAILAHLGKNTTLQPRAERFLTAWKGKWIPPIDKVEDYPEILNAEFVRLVARVPEFLTEEEGKLYAHLHHITRVRRAAPLKLQVQIGFVPSLEELTPDTKLPCSRCGLRRSFTLSVEGVCALCISSDLPDNEKPHKPSGPFAPAAQGDDTSVTTDAAAAVAEWRADCPEPAEDRSHMVECRTCHVLYAVLNTQALRVTPKCYFCREKLPCEFVGCISCGNRFCAPTAASREGPFTCAVCTSEPAKSFATREVSLHDLITQNPELMKCLGFQPAASELLFGRTGLFKLWTGSKRELLDAVPAERPVALAWAGKPVMNVAGILDDLVERVLHGKLTETCNLCFEDKALLACQSACGLCSTQACAACLGRWYGRLAPGRLYVPSEGLCPFCKRTPKAATLRTFNRAACRLAGRRALEFRADHYYGWCRRCFRVREAMPRECARDAPVLEDFACEACLEQEQAQLLLDEEAILRTARPCPGCQAPSVKISGCDHITCTRCDAHWCWQCGGAFDQEVIYQHLLEAHGGIGFDEVNSDFEEDQ